MVATGLTGSLPADEKNKNVMQAFVYENKDDIDAQSDDDNNADKDESINVFAVSSSNNNQSFSSDNDDEYDIPAFLRKK